MSKQELGHTQTPGNDLVRELRDWRKALDTNTIREMTVDQITIINGRSLSGACADAADQLDALLSQVNQLEQERDQLLEKIRLHNPSNVERDNQLIMAINNDLLSQVRQKDEALRAAYEQLGHITGSANSYLICALEFLEAARSPAPQHDAVLAYDVVEAATLAALRASCADVCSYAVNGAPGTGCYGECKRGDWGDDEIKNMRVAVKAALASAANLLRQSAPVDNAEVLIRRETRPGWGNEYELKKSPASPLADVAGMREAAALRCEKEAQEVEASHKELTDADAKYVNACYICAGLIRALPIPESKADAASTKLDLHPVASAVGDADRYLNEECVSRWKKGGAAKATEALQLLAKEMFYGAKP